MQQELTKELKQLVEENKQLRAAIALAHEEGRKRDELVLQNKELQSERHFEKISSTNKLRQQWHEHLLIMQEVGAHPQPEAARSLWGADVISAQLADGERGEEEGNEDRREEGR